jgi:transglycosylase-like protein with SLT domain
MLVDPSNFAAGSTVTSAIRQASQATGTSFNYLLATAQVESGLNPQAGAPTSSARGLFQFVEQTWLGTIKQAGPALGYGRYADAITRTASGHYQVSDPAMRSEILKLRNDPAANAIMAGAFTKANAAILTNKLGRAPSEGELYMAHFLGAGGAARLIGHAASNPNASAADLFGPAARANASIFYDRATGAARSLAQCATSSPRATTSLARIRGSLPSPAKWPATRPRRSRRGRRPLPFRTLPGSPTSSRPPRRS